MHVDACCPLSAAAVWLSSHISFTSRVTDVTLDPGTTDMSSPSQSASSHDSGICSYTNTFTTNVQYGTLIAGIQDTKTF